MSKLVTTCLCWGHQQKLSWQLHKQKFPEVAWLSILRLEWTWMNHLHPSTTSFSYVLEIHGLCIGIYSSRRPKNIVFFSVEGWDFCWHETTKQSVWQKKIDRLRVRPSNHPPIGSNFLKKMDPMFHHGQEDTKKTTTSQVVPPSDQRSAGDLLGCTSKFTAWPGR